MLIKNKLINIYPLLLIFFNYPAESHGCQCVTYFFFIIIFAAMLVNDELLQRLTNGKANLNKPLVIHRSSETSVPLDYHSPPEEVTDWLRGKGFSEP